MESSITPSSQEYTPISTAQEQKIKDTFYDIDFSARKSIRYLTKRKRFFENFHYFLVVITALSSSGAFTSLISGHGDALVAQILTGAMAIAAALDLAIGFAKKATQYDRLQKRFSDLLIKIIQSEKNAELLKKLQVERLEIEKNEPPTLVALELFCHNEELRAQGQDEHLRKFDWFHRTFMHVWSFEGWLPPLLSESRKPPSQ